MERQKRIPWIVLLQYICQKIQSVIMAPDADNRIFYLIPGPKHLDSHLSAGSKTFRHRRYPDKPVCPDKRHEDPGPPAHWGCNQVLTYSADLHPEEFLLTKG